MVLQENDLRSVPVGERVVPNDLRILSKKGFDVPLLKNIIKGTYAYPSDIARVTDSGSEYFKSIYNGSLYLRSLLPPEELTFGFVPVITQPKFAPARVGRRILKIAERYSGRALLSSAENCVWVGLTAQETSGFPRRTERYVFGEDPVANVKNWIHWLGSISTWKVVPEQLAESSPKFVAEANKVLKQFAQSEHNQPASDKFYYYRTPIDTALSSNHIYTLSKRSTNSWALPYLLKSDIQPINFADIPKKNTAILPACSVGTTYFGDRRAGCMGYEERRQLENADKLLWLHKGYLKPQNSLTVKDATSLFGDIFIGIDPQTPFISLLGSSKLDAIVERRLNELYESEFDDTLVMSFPKKTAKA